MKRLLNLFRPRKCFSEFIHDDKNGIQKKYEKLLEKDIDVVSTCVTRDWARFQNSEKFIMIVTYKKNNTNE